MDDLPKPDIENAVTDDETIQRVQGTRKNYKNALKAMSKISSKPSKLIASSDADASRDAPDISQIVPVPPSKRKIRFPRFWVIKRKEGKLVIPIPNARKSDLRDEELWFVRTNKNKRQQIFDVPDEPESESDVKTEAKPDAEAEAYVNVEKIKPQAIVVPLTPKIKDKTPVSSLVPEVDDELDDEWLGVEENQLEKESKENFAEPQKSQESLEQEKASTSRENSLSTDSRSVEFRESMKYFWWALVLSGRMPFQEYTVDGHVKYKLNKWSRNFVYFAISSAFLVFCTTTMGYSFIRIFVVVERGHLHFYKKIERLDVDKYWIYAIVTFAASTMASSCSLATIFDDGLILADYLSRWNIAISVLKYRPVENIRLYFWLNVVTFCVYAIIVVLLFATNLIPAVRGASGLIGLTIFRPFTTEIRFSRFFPLIQGFGLFVHLYAIFSSRAILLMITLYCKLLVNMAKKWNLRLAYVLGMLGEIRSTQKAVAVISFRKLFIEHTIIVGFLRHTGRIFTVALGIFYTLKLLELLILLYRTVTLIIYPPPIFNETVVQNTPAYLPPIPYADPGYIRIGAVCLLLFFSILEWLITTEQIIAPGEVILDGYSYVRRYGLILSRTSQRRRFVQSINHAFSHSTDYFVRAGFTINREFTFEMFFWLVTFTALLIAFHPFQLQKELITVCNHEGKCVVISRSRIAWSTGDIPPSASVELAKAIDVYEEEFDNSVIATPIERIPGIATYFCQGYHFGKPVRLEFPTVCFGNGKVFSAYPHSSCPMTPRDIRPPYDKFPNNIPARNCHKTNPGFFYTANVRDTCLNLPFDSVLTGKPALQKARILMEAATNIFYVTCCYDYGFSNEQLDQCNQVFTEATTQRCNLGHSNRTEFPFRLTDLSANLQKCLNNLYSRNPTCAKINVDDCLCQNRSTSLIIPPVANLDFNPPEKIRCQSEAKLATG